MKIMRKFILILIIIGISGCKKELSITDFSDDFSSYTSELRIEAILNPTDFMNSIVRVDKTILVTDTTLFNGRDDNGDSIIDDYAEILPLIHDSTMTSVLLIEKSSGNIVAEFEWQVKASKIEQYHYNDQDDTFEIKEYYYSGYKPKNQYKDVQIEYGKEYEFQITTTDNNVITGTTACYPPAELVMDGTIWDADTLLLNSSQNNLVQFLANNNVSLGNFTFREVINNDSVSFSHSAFFPPSESDKQGYSIFELTQGMFPIGLSQVTVSILDNNYSQYFISSLPLRDEALSNLRDQNGYVILGIAGSVTNTTLYVNNIL